jgi:PIN domain nuclease of toxin-antitoxin system
MRLLLDTHIILAIFEKQTEKFPFGVRRLLADTTAEFHASVASLWEIAIKYRLGKLDLTPALETLPELLGVIGIELAPITAPHVLTAAYPEPMTRDPFDRLLLAQCQAEDFRLVTIDRALIGHRLAAQAT